MDSLGIIEILKNKKYFCTSFCLTFKTQWFDHTWPKVRCFSFWSLFEIRNLMLRFYAKLPSHILSVLISSSPHYQTVIRLHTHHRSALLLFQLSFICRFAAHLWAIYSHQYNAPDHDWIRDRPWVWLQSNHEAGAWIETGSRTAARLKTLTNTSLDARQYCINVINPQVSMLLCTILPKNALRLTNCFNHTANGVSGRSYVILQLTHLSAHLLCCFQFPNCQLHPYIPIPLQAPFSRSYPILSLRHFFSISVLAVSLQ